MSRPELIPTVILVPKPENPRRRLRFAGEPIPWVKVAIGGTVVWLFVAVVLTVYFSMQESATRQGNEQALNAMPAIKPARPDPIDNKPAPGVKEEEEFEDFEQPALGKGEFVDCAAIGTNVKFMKEPTDAFKRAKAEKKMVFIMHLSGNLEDKDFT